MFLFIYPLYQNFIKIIMAYIVKIYHAKIQWILLAAEY